MERLGNPTLKLIFKDQLGNSFFCKDESINPSGSIKDIPVYYILNKYKEDGLLINHPNIIEPTSGNTGISLAYFQKEFGYHAIIVLPKAASEQRKTMIRSYGGEVIEVDGGMKECKELVTKMLQDNRRSLTINQFSNPLNAESHVFITGPQIQHALDKIDYIFAGVGTSGTLVGIARYFKKITSNSRLIAVEPSESKLLSKGTPNPHRIEGIGANFVPEIFDSNLVFDFADSDYESARKEACTLHELGYDVGISSGAALSAAKKYCLSHKLKNQNIVVIFPDKGDRYSW